jgi:hypothetical protein
MLGDGSVDHDVQRTEPGRKGEQGDALASQLKKKKLDHNEDI